MSRYKDALGNAVYGDKFSKHHALEPMCWDAARLIERLLAYKHSYPPDFIEKLQHDLDVAEIRIKELEYVLKATVSNSAHIITNSQIDAAWRYMEYHSDAYVRGKIEQALYRIGIVRCEECEGMGEYQEIKRHEWVFCPDCKGHGWVKEDR